MSDPLELLPRIAVLDGKRVLLGVTGSIAAYKAVDLASKLTQAGAHVDVLMTRAAEAFVTPLTFRSVTGQGAYTEADLWGTQAHVLHVELAKAADVFVVAPATANTIFKMAYGVSDTLVSLAALAVECPIVVAPAMDAGMYSNTAVRANVEILHARGAAIVGPAEGRMASGLTGRGRLVETDELLGHIRLALGRSGPLAHERVVVTAGGTQEPLDPVRVIANRSSGKQGFALAQAALDRGAEVTLIAGPTQLPTPVGAERVDVMDAAGMKQAVLEKAGEAVVLIMAAAVADFRPSEPASGKIKKSAGLKSVKLEPTEDILLAVAQARAKDGRPGVVVGFAAESQDLVANARAKLEEKGLSLIVANDITAQDAGFGSDSNRVTVIDGDGGVQELPLMSKAAVAERVLDRVQDLLAGRG
jgi:phosphopantothenoylcysteine decarboxylase / phosphopantothenate---cysteine ligase